MNPYQAYAPQAQAQQSFAPQAPAQAPAQALRPSIITSEALGADASAMTGWKYAAQAAPGLVSQLLQLRAQIEVEYPIRDIVVLGMGGSALGARVFEAAYYEDLARLGVRLRIVDTTEPSTIAGLLQDFDAAAGLVIVSSKSGGTIEPLCLGQIFFNHLSAVLGSAQTAAAHFIAISDADTPLSQLAITQAWRGLINTAPNVG
ncbi:MAG: hypothetical protein FWE46_05915, partial [Coriobacteriia bacterium]|nr:hypothetical protein [Coriobacteriia bacterium]